MNRFEQDVYNRYIEKVADISLPVNIARRAGNAVGGGIIGAGIGAVANVGREALTRGWNKLRGKSMEPTFWQKLTGNVPVRPTYRQRALQGAKWGGGIGAAYGASKPVKDGYSRYSSLVNSAQSGIGEAKSWEGLAKDHLDYMRKSREVFTGDPKGLRNWDRKTKEVERNLAETTNEVSKRQAEYDKYLNLLNNDWKSAFIDSLMPGVY